MTRNYDFNGNQLPKFWFGDRVIHLLRKGTIYGMEWRDDNSHSGTLESRFGWIYWVHFDKGYGTQGVHEKSLVKEF
jgi:hypothetical protein